MQGEHILRAWHEEKHSFCRGRPLAHALPRKIQHTDHGHEYSADGDGHLERDGGCQGKSCDKVSVGEGLSPEFANPARAVREFHNFLYHGNTTKIYKMNHNKAQTQLEHNADLIILQKYRQKCIKKR